MAKPYSTLNIKFQNKRLKKLEKKINKHYIMLKLFKDTFWNTPHQKNKMTNEMIKHYLEGIYYIKIVDEEKNNQKCQDEI